MPFLSEMYNEYSRKLILLLRGPIPIHRHQQLSIYIVSRTLLPLPSSQTCTIRLLKRGFLFLRWVHFSPAPGAPDQTPAQPVHDMLPCSHALPLTNVPCVSQNFLFSTFDYNLVLLFQASCVKQWILEMGGLLWKHKTVRRNIFVPDTGVSIIS